MTYADGDKYVGTWVEGKMNGQGTYVYADGDKYEGEWREDKRHGKGTVTYRGQDGSIVEQYQGDWHEGKMHGFGRYVYADGGVYEGQWSEGKMSGRGTCAFPIAMTAHARMQTAHWGHNLGNPPFPVYARDHVP